MPWSRPRAATARRPDPATATLHHRPAPPAPVSRRLCCVCPSFLHCERGIPSCILIRCATPCCWSSARSSGAWPLWPRRWAAAMWGPTPFWPAAAGWPASFWPGSGWCAGSWASGTGPAPAGSPPPRFAAIRGRCALRRVPVCRLRRPADGRGHRLHRQGQLSHRAVHRAGAAGGGVHPQPAGLAHLAVHRRQCGGALPALHGRAGYAEPLAAASGSCCWRRCSSRCRFCWWGGTAPGRTAWR